MISILRDVVALVGKYTLAGQMNSCALQDAVDVATATVFGDASQRRVAQLYNPTLGMEGYYSATATDAPTHEMLGVPGIPVSVLPDTAAVGKVAYLFRAIIGEFNWGAGVGELLPFSLTAEGSQGQRLVRGVVLGGPTAAPPSAPDAGAQLGAVSAGQRLYIALHVTAITGTGMTIEVQSDADNAFLTPTSQSSTLVAAPGSYWIEVPGPITDPWFRVNRTMVDGTANYTLTAGVI